jgi:hypothetical protein
MNCNLQGLRNSPHWRKNLDGYIQFNDGYELRDKDVRKIVNEGIKRGFKTVMEIPDDLAKQWLNFKSE